MISLDEASGMSICPWPIPVVWWHLPLSIQWITIEVLWMMELGVKCSVSIRQEYLKYWTTPNCSKLSPGGWCSQVYITAEGDLDVIFQEVRAEKLLAMVRLSSFCLFSSPCLFRSLLLGRLSEDSQRIQFISDTLISTVHTQGWRCKVTLSLTLTGYFYSGN